jgi:hypothetical protein
LYHLLAYNYEKAAEHLPPFSFEHLFLSGFARGSRTLRELCALRVEKNLTRPSGYPGSPQGGPRQAKYLTILSRVNPLESTLLGHAATVDSKRLTERLNLLESTLTESRGGGPQESE